MSREIGACSVDGCDRPGGRSVTTDSPVCELHYQRQLRQKHALPIPRDPGEKPVKMKATELLDANWRTILREIRKPAGDDYIILREGRPVAAVVDYDYYLHLLGVFADVNDAVGGQP